MASFGHDTTGIDVAQHFRKQVEGKTIVITGASAGGLGAETALSLARGGPSHLILLARSQSKVQPVISEIRQINANVEAHFVPIELDRLSTVSEAANSIKAIPGVSKIDILINNAGIMATPYRQNEAGLESQFATNHIGHFYLTKSLQPLLAVAGHGTRIINLSSDGYMICPVKFDDYNFSNGETYDMWSGYGQSKTANILFTRYLATKLAKFGVQSFAVHPGVIMETSLANHIEDHSAFEGIGPIAERNTGIAFKVNPNPKNLQQGCSTTLVTALDPSLMDLSGSYFEDCQAGQLREYASSEENAERLWKLSEKLIGEDWNLNEWS